MNQAATRLYAYEDDAVPLRIPCRSFGWMFTLPSPRAIRRAKASPSCRDDVIDRTQEIDQCDHEESRADKRKDL